MDAVLWRERRAGKLEAAARWWAEGFPGADIEIDIERLRAEHWDEEAIAEERTQAAELAEAGDIWPQNWPTVEVFCNCKWDVQAGMKTIRTGISSMEIESVCNLLSIPQEPRREIIWGMRVMVDAALPILNRSED